MKPRSDLNILMFQDNCLNSKEMLSYPIQTFDQTYIQRFYRYSEQ